MNKIIWFTTWVRDLFHIWHLNILKNAKSMCDELIVAVTSDERTFREKWKYPIIQYSERVEILKHITLVDKVIEHHHHNEWWHYNDLYFNIVFKWSDRQWTEKRNKLENDFSLLWVRVVFFPYTQTTSSTHISKIITSNTETI